MQRSSKPATADAALDMQLLNGIEGVRLTLDSGPDHGHPPTTALSGGTAKSSRERGERDRESPVATAALAADSYMPDSLPSAGRDGALLSNAPNTTVASGLTSLLGVDALDGQSGAGASTDALDAGQALGGTAASNGGPVNLSSVKANPKFQRIVQHIEGLVERTRTARLEMAQMAEVTQKLREQCALQERECEALEKDQTKVREEVNVLSSRFQVLSTEKVRIEQKLEELRLENAKLDAFLSQAKETPIEDA